ncbi:MAG TPA: carboxypeptidase-like regulatory domain-containing protein [Verrucomicrobiae bacterium]|nr:carboxypeptidase-like regulatory domain-containing protein [Verrucomicrobiae bacterium]
MSTGSNTTKCVWTGVFLAALVFLFSAGRVQGQAQTATIFGTATDPSGGALAGAHIQVTNVGTNISQSTTTDAQGRYTIAQLPVGTYSVEASLSGFQTVVHKGVTLSVGGTLVVDFSLPVGEVTQTVNVESDVSRVETETSEVSTLISPQQMRDLPLNGRNFEQLITLAPGVSTVGAALNAVTGRLYGMQDNYSVAGSRPTGQMFLLDNTDIRDFWEHGTGSGYAATSLGVEAIGEFQVLTNTYTAQFAGNGAVINATSRSGTNDLHGGAYEFFRNNVLDARDIVDPVTGPPPFRRNQFGGDLGGPIKKNKLFFFGNYEGLRQSLATTTDIFLPEPYTVQGMLPCSLVTPTPGTCTPSTSANSTQAGIPIGAVPGANTTTEQIAALYSLCKGCHLITPTIGAVNTNLPGNCVTIGCDLGGYFETAAAPPLTIEENYYMGRVDYTLGSNDSLFARFTFDNANVGDPRDPYQIFPETDHTRNQFLTITERHVASATLVNSIHFGYVRNNENSQAQPALTNAQLSAANAFSSSLGGPAITSDPLHFVDTQPGELPRQDGQNGGFQQVIFPIGPDPNRPDEIVQNKFSGGDDITWTHGAHSLKIGAVVTRVQTQNLQTAYSNGGFFLSYGVPAPVYDAQFWLSGTPFLAFAVPTVPALNNATRYFREIMVAPYIQDDWKVSSRLTLNLGFRYDYDTNPVGWAFPHQPMTTLVGSFLPPVGPVAPPGGAPVFTPVRHVFANNVNAGNLEPRFGFAFDPFRDHKTSIRGGVGIFSDPTSGRLWESNFINTAPSGSSFLVFPSFPNLCATGCNPPGAVSEFAGVTYQPRGGPLFESPYQITYNLNLQRELWRSTVLSVGYVGSVSRHLWTQGDINPPKCLTFPDCKALPQIPKSYPTASDATFTVSNACHFPTQTSCYGSGVQFPPPAPFAQTGPRINGAFGSLIQAYNTGASAYNSLQVSLNRQFARNIAGQFNYTWSRCVDDGSFASSLEEFAQLVVDRYNERYAYGNCTFDIRHNISANGLYSLPFKGNRLVEGWQISAIVGIHTGLPLNVYNNTLTSTDPAFLGTQWGSQANYTFAPGCHPNHLLKKRINATTIQWFDPACYEAQAPGFLGNVKRDSLPGPGTFSADLSVTKNTKITEKLNLQFRTECFNCFNHFNVGGTGAGILGEINAPGGTTGQTTFSQSPVVTPRQIQFALKLDF